MSKFLHADENADDNEDTKVILQYLGFSPKTAELKNLANETKNFSFLEWLLNTDPDLNLHRPLYVFSRV